MIVTLDCTSTFNIVVLDTPSSSPFFEFQIILLSLLSGTYIRDPAFSSSPAMVYGGTWYPSWPRNPLHLQVAPWPPLYLRRKLHSLVVTSRLQSTNPEFKIRIDGLPEAVSSSMKFFWRP